MSRKSSINKIKRSNSASKDIEAGLVMDLYLKGHSPITTHTNISLMQETDVISISKSDYIYEYEVKISRSDFKADFKKTKHTLITEGKFIKETKEETLYLLPNYFYFVVPENLINVDEIPEYAGLIYVSEKQEYITIKKAPLLHKTKASNDFIRQMSHKLTCKLVFKKID